VRIRYTSEYIFEYMMTYVYILHVYIDILIHTYIHIYIYIYMYTFIQDDRKDGLWIWGLFAEPKYPFLYFSLGIFKSIMLPSGLEKPIWDGEGVPNDRYIYVYMLVHIKNDHTY
jgi:hypothetical protein